jgi:hypothetical protein
MQTTLRLCGEMPRHGRQHLGANYASAPLPQHILKNQLNKKGNIPNINNKKLKLFSILKIVLNISFVSKFIGCLPTWINFWLYPSAGE